MSRRGGAAVAALLAGWALCGGAAGEFVYRLDDGTGNFNIGPSQFDAQMLWGNCFEAAAGAETITSISVALAGSVPPGRDITVVLFEDPTDDLDPTDAVPLTLAAGITAAAPPNAFVEFPIAPTTVSGGFFVAAMMELRQGEVAARMDPDARLGRSWLFFDGTIDLGDLGGAPLYYNMADTPFNGSWMIRATGVPEPAGAGGALLMLLAVARRRAPGGAERVSS